jgi:Lamin Tail Domain
MQSGAPAVMDYINYPATSADQSFGAMPDGDARNRHLLFVPTPGGSNEPTSMKLPVFINEWMSENTGFIPDPANGLFEDWFELFNAGTNTVELEGYFLSDQPIDLTQFQIPAGFSIGPRGFLLVWADGQSDRNGANRPDLHVNFKLSNSGETISLFTPNGAIVDSVVFGPQNGNVSAGRYPDGSPDIYTFTTSTPRAANVRPAGSMPHFSQISLSGAQLTFGWTTVSGLSYRIEFKDELNQSAWTALAQNMIAAGSSLSTTVNVAETRHRFFRIVQVD